MKKLFSLLPALLLTSSASIAQGPVLTAENAGPKPGDVNGTYIADTTGIAPAQPGADMIWNYSNIQPDTIKMPSEWVAPSSTPYASSFPAATVCGITSAGGIPMLYSYEKVATDQWTVLGMANSILTLIYLDPEKIFQFPFAYQSSFNDIFFGMGMIGIFPSFRTGSRHVEANGWGKLILPNREVSNVLMVSIHQQYNDSSQIAVTKFIYDGQFWYDGINSAPLLQIYRTTTWINGDSVSGKYVTVSQEALSVEDVHENYFSVYPNPAKDKVRITLKSTDLQVSIINIFDHQGRKIKSVKADHSPVMIDVSDLAPGMYFIRSDKGGSGKFVVAE